MSAAIDKKKEIELSKRETEIIKTVKDVRVVDSGSFEYASDLVLDINKAISKTEEFFREPKDLAHKTHKSITARERQILDPLKKQKEILRDKISDYLTEEERKRKEEQERIDKERREKEEEEIKKLENRAKKAEAKGDDAKAENLREQSEEVHIEREIIAPTVNKTTRMNSGSVSQTKFLSVEIVDPLLFVQQIAKKDAPISIVDFKDKKLKDWVTINELKKFPGLEISEKINPSFRGKK